MSYNNRLRASLAVCDWCISILVVVVNDWRISILIVLTRSCSLTSLLWYRSAVVLNFNSTIPIYIVRVKSNVNGFFNPTGVPMWVSVSKFNFVPKRIMSALVSML